MDVNEILSGEFLTDSQIEACDMQELTMGESVIKLGGGGSSHHDDDESPIPKEKPNPQYGSGTSGKQKVRDEQQVRGGQQVRGKKQVRDGQQVRDEPEQQQ